MPVVRIVTVLGFGLFTSLTALASHKSFDPCIDESSDPGREALCKMVNTERADHQLSPLVLDAELSEVAQAHAEDMLKRAYFSHTSPDGGTMKGRLIAAGIKYGWAGENIARGQKTSAKVMTSWMNSKGHRANILGKQYKALGLGRAGAYWVQVFTN